MTSAESAAPPAPLPLTRPSARVLAIAVIWLGFGLVAGLAEYLTVARGAGLGWSYILEGPVLAGAIWVPLTLGAVGAARRWPLVPPRPGPILLHVGLAVCASFVLNLLWGAAHSALGSAPWPRLGFLNGVGWAGLRHLHLNAGAYGTIALLVTVWDARHAAARGIPGTDREAAGDAEWARTLSVRVGRRTRVVPVAEIDRIEGAGDYVRLHVGERRYLLAERMKTLERRLDPEVFARVHRSTIVNLTRIRELEHRSHGDYEARLEDGSTVRVTRSRSDAIRDLL